ncbi:glucosaminidase domain-containing protein [Alteromonas lipolytica]|uniref:Flagellar biosynthesis protein FlgJ n=1 Tax=Alteromonas lipolytica TaxID=1856405 RepID=A0A1E8FJ99_9ALTE|nr:glucosaminidase domain-containing protein [Alteromonas lipolytica]OFI36019.1 flagellar biosynthesis protein FlgJ [Alteromonas lipolytica]GGF71637.1 glycoside hydrolase family 73 [Alteromonas lipolytica]
MTNTRTTTIAALLAALLIAVVVWFSFFSRVTPPDFSEFPAGPERKQAFFGYFEPIVHELNAEIAADRTTVQEKCQADNEPALAALAKKYRVDETDTKAESLCKVLLRRVDIVPASLALAQAANESAWGTSRFARLGNNFFGQWCFVKGCGIVPNDRDQDKAHEVADFRSPKDSVASYMMNLNSHDAYKTLRNIRQSLREKNATVSGIELSHGLNSYSERGEEYGKELREMIRFNKLTQYDKPA